MKSLHSKKKWKEPRMKEELRGLGRGKCRQDTAVLVAADSMGTTAACDTEQKREGAKGDRILLS